MISLFVIFSLDALLSFFSFCNQTKEILKKTFQKFDFR